MTLEELAKIIRVDLKALAPNTVEHVTLYRKACQAAYELDDYPVLAGLENTWKLIEADFPLLGKDRDCDNFESAVSRFMFNVDSGFYPPPEIMLSLLRCFELYYAFQGHKSLDEIFFGRPHKKKSSESFLKRQQTEYRSFHFFYVNSDEFLGVDLKGKSLVERAEAYLTGDVGREVEPESFLRGYRRWLAKMQGSD